MAFIGSGRFVSSAVSFNDRKGLVSPIELSPSSSPMETLFRLSFRLRPISAAELCIKTTIINSVYRPNRTIFSKPEFLNPSPAFRLISTTSKKYSSSSSIARAGWLRSFGEKKKPIMTEIVKAGDPVLHEQAREVRPEEVGSERIQKIIDDMIKVMRFAPGVGLAAPQIGIPLKIIVLEDTEEFISYAPKEEINEQDRRPFDLTVIVNPKLKKKSNKTARFFEGCLSVDGFRAVVERYLEVEVTGFNRDGQPIKVNAKGWKARILQHECDHLDGTLYVDKMVPRTFRTVDNLDLPLAEGCPKLGVC